MTCVKRVPDTVISTVIHCYLMRFSHLTKYLDRLEKTASRNEMTVILAEALKKSGKDEVDKICYLLLGELLPPYTGVEFNLAEKMMVQALSAAYDSNKEAVTRLYKTAGDLGDVAEKLAFKKGGGREKNLQVTDVYNDLLEVARESGVGSQKRKINKLSGLLARLDPVSAKFVTRIPIGKMRLGFSEVTLLDALSVMEKGDKSARPEIERAFNVTADIGEIAKRIKNGGLASFKKITAKPGVPIRPSLAERLPKIEEVFEKAGPEVGVEKKLDGFRTQIHVWQEHGVKQIALFSRNLENTTAMFPEIVESTKKIKVEGAILDGETIGYNPKTRKFLPFQETVQRKRKHDIAEFTKKIPLSIFIFDILYLDGRSLIDLAFKERRKILEKVLSRPGKNSATQLASQKITSDINIIKEALSESLDADLEGLVIKKLDSPYEAGSRGYHWIKLKATSAALGNLRAAPLGRHSDERSLPATGASPNLAGRAGMKSGKTKILDTIDCLIMGAYKGKGKRAKFGVGGLLLGISGGDDRYYSISRLGTGLSDKQFYEIKKKVNSLKAAERPKEYVVDKDTKPDIWVKPGLVVEILADEITRSPRHTAGMGTDRRGYSLRFPRLVRFRDDKSPEDATTVQEVERLHKQQKH